MPKLLKFFILIMVSLLSIYATASPLGLTSPLLNQRQAFAFQATQQDNTLTLHWQIQPNYYLYRQKIKVSGQAVQLGTLNLPHGEPFQDELLGETEVLTGDISTTLTLHHIADNASVTVYYQGCAAQGFCYPPIEQTIYLTTVTALNSENTLANKQTLQSIVPNAPVETTKQPPFSPLWAIFIGMGLALTPCVLPMYPLILSIFNGTTTAPSRKRLMLLVFIYIQGMALTYTLLGIGVAHMGLAFSGILQHRYVIIGLSVLFVLLALSMFGVYSLQLPTRLQTQLMHYTNQQKAGSLLGVFVMGIIAAILCSPCTTAPLSAILLYISQTESLFVGGSLLYCYAIGLGFPLLLLALLGQTWLPRRGAWMIHIKELFGFIILVLPLLLLERLLNQTLITVLWSLWATAMFGWCFILALTYRTLLGRSIATLLLIATLICSQPLQHLFFTSNSVQSSEINPLTRITTPQELVAAQDYYISQNRPVILDFYADWCVACRQFTTQTLSDHRVTEALSHANAVILTVDVTAMTKQQRELLTQFNIVGLPTTLFYQATGDEVISLQLNGFENVPRFLVRMERFSQLQTPHTVDGK